MRLRLILLFTLMITFCSTYGQELQTLMLKDSEVPASYKATDEMLYKSIQAASFYKQTEVYESIVGKVKNKTFQSYESKRDEGTIFYFEFEKNFAQTVFLEALLWGGRKPTKEHPEEYFVKDNILVIWSFAAKSELKKISKDKITALLK